MTSRLVRFLHAPARAGAREALRGRVRCPHCGRDTSHRRPIVDDQLFDPQAVQCGWCRDTFELHAGRAAPAVRMLGWSGVSALATVAAATWWATDLDLGAPALTLLATAGCALVLLAERELARVIVRRRLETLAAPATHVRARHATN